MQKLKLSILLAIFCCAVVSDAAKPNVILIMADDISAREFEFHGSTAWCGVRAKTPVLDRLSREGCHLSTMWSSTVCMPTRAMIMTGRYPHLTKWWDNGEFGRGKNGRPYGVPESSPLLIGKLAGDAGYRFIWVGKTHVTLNSRATQYGFDEGMFSAGERTDEENTFPHMLNVKNPEFWNYHSFYWWPQIQTMKHPSHRGKPFQWVKTELNDYGPDIEMEHTLNFMDRAKAQNKSFFVYHTPHLGHKAVDMANPKFEMTWPGTPKLTWNAKTQTYTRHSPKITAHGKLNTLGTTYTKENITPNALKYHIEYLDYQVWQYLTKLKEMGELENTVIIFTADNGTGNAAWKASVVRQRGVHVPCVIYAPGQPEFAKGRQDILSDLTDILPTLAEIMNAKLPSAEEYELSGKSLWPYLTQKAKQHRDWIYSFKGKRQLVRGQHLMRDGDGNWWDASHTPADLDSFTLIKNPETLNGDRKTEWNSLKQVLARFAREDFGGTHSFHADASMPITDAEKRQMKAKEDARQKHFLRNQGKMKQRR
jgi:arylsulfatase A-like enzyme